MGACLVANNLRDHEKSTQQSPSSVRVEIAEQLNQKSLPQTSSKRLREEQQVEYKLQKKSTLKSKSTINEGSKQYISSKIIESNCSLKYQEVANEQSQKINKSGDATKNPLQMLNQGRKRVAIEEEDEKQENCFSDQQSIDEKQQFSNKQICNQIESPHSRIIEIDVDMVGKGLTEMDNQMINLSMSTKKPMRFNAIKFINGSIYSGQWLNGKRQGNGVLVWDDGERYEGQWNQNFSEGKGKLIYNENQWYEGDFVRNCRHGYGVYTNSGTTYEGQWKNDKQQGKGIQRWGNGQYYSGQWLAGWKNGYGQLLFEDGSYYRGDFNGNEIHGHGFYQWNNLKTYQGDWEHNRMCGRGVLIWKNGDRYEGQFKNDKMHGQGLLINANGINSLGIFQNGKKHGIFTQTDLNKGTSIVEYHMGKLKRNDLKLHKRKRDNSDSKTVSSATQSY